MRRLRLAVFGLVALVVGAAVMAYLLGDDYQTEVEAKRGDTPAPVSSLNRADDAGADVLRTYLQAALTCTPDGLRIMQQLSRPGDSARDLFTERCARNGNRPWTDAIHGELDPDELDARGRALWAVSADDGGLPRALHVRLRMPRGEAWEIDRACSAVCG
jgi:hypothetical protein